MKKIVTLMLVLAIAMTAVAQQKSEHNRKHKDPPKIEEMVNNLSAIQKKRLNTVMENSRKEVDRLQAELEHQKGFLESVRRKLGNASFVAHAPAAVVEGERKKEADALSRIEALEKSLAALGK